MMQLIRIVQLVTTMLCVGCQTASYKVSTAIEEHVGAPVLQEADRQNGLNRRAESRVLPASSSTPPLGSKRAKAIRIAELLTRIVEEDNHRPYRVQEYSQPRKGTPNEVTVRGSHRAGATSDLDTVALLQHELYNTTKVDPTLTRDPLVPDVAVVHAPPPARSVFRQLHHTRPNTPEFGVNHIVRGKISDSVQPKQLLVSESDRPIERNQSEVADLRRRLDALIKQRQHSPVHQQKTTTRKGDARNSPDAAAESVDSEDVLSTRVELLASLLKEMSQRQTISSATFASNQRSIGKLDSTPYSSDVTEHAGRRGTQASFRDNLDREHSTHIRPAQFATSNPDGYLERNSYDVSVQSDKNDVRKRLDDLITRCHVLLARDQTTMAKKVGPRPTPDSIVGSSAVANPHHRSVLHHIFQGSLEGRRAFQEPNSCHSTNPVRHPPGT